jgi:iron transport multicopper oxidase
MYFAQGGQYLPGYNENATLPFVPGRTYRLRVINMSALAMFHFYIDGHDMRIIEADGVCCFPSFLRQIIPTAFFSCCLKTDTQEYPVDYLTLSVAQRYSVLVTARNDTSSNFLIHANQDPVMYDTGT